MGRHSLPETDNELPSINSRPYPLYFEKFFKETYVDRSLSNFSENEKTSNLVNEIPLPRLSEVEDIGETFYLFDEEVEDEKFDSVLFEAISIDEKQDLKFRNINKKGIVAVIPAHNEEDSIQATVDSLLNQTLPIDLILVMADNCDDDTVKIVQDYKDSHVLVRETVDNKEKKVGALIQAWDLLKDSGFTYWLGVDADTKLDDDCVELLFEEIDSDKKIGGVMAKYNFDQSESRGFVSNFLFRMQRLEFTGWINDLLHRNRQAYVLGGQASIFRVEALADVSASNHGKRGTPWSTSTLVEDMELTWKLNEVGYTTTVSEEARAWPGAMSTFHSLWAQRRKWDQGIASLLHENKFPAAILKTPRNIQLKSLLDASVRFFFLLLLSVSLVFNMFTWFWIWIIPPLLAVILNAYMASITPKRTFVDILIAGTLIGPEIYLFFRLAGWSTSWISVLRGRKFDGWAKQYSAEAGKSSWLTKFIVTACIVALTVFLAMKYDVIGKLREWQGVSGQWVDYFVHYGWILVTILTAIAVLDMLYRIFRSDHGMRP